MHPNRYEVSPAEAVAIENDKKRWAKLTDNMIQKDVQYAYGEDKVLAELSTYIQATYGQHYAKAGGQLFDQFIDAPEEVVTFCKINAMKYLKRYGFKDGHNRKDIMKALHYCVLMMCFADMVDNKTERT